MHECILYRCGDAVKSAVFSRLMGQTSNRAANEYGKSALLQLHAFASCPCAAQPRPSSYAIWHITNANTDYQVKGIDYIDNCAYTP
jgi:hypothetical protein